MNTFVRRAGNSDYLSSFAQMLRGLGFRSHYAFEQGRAFASVGCSGYLESIDKVHVRKAVVLRSRGLVIKPSLLPQAAMRRFFRKSGDRHPGWPPTSRQHWGKPPLSGETARWMGKVSNALEARLFVSNYFNCADAFRYLHRETIKAILVHDVMAMRSRSLTAAGAPSDMDVGMIEREKRAFSEADICFAIKEEDASFIRDLAPGTRVVTVPFCMPVADEQGVERSPYRAVFVGADSAPNFDAVRWLSDELWPRVRRHIPSAELDIIGRCGGVLEGQASQGVNIRGFVEDLPAALARASLAVAPIRFGSGLKIKTLMGLAHGLPTVATHTGAEGIEGAGMDILRLIEDEKSFTAATVEMMRAEGFQDRYLAARQFVSDKHSLISGQMRIHQGLRDMISLTV